MTNVVSRIIKWVSTLKYWEQATFSRILSGEPFDDDVYEELLVYLLEDEKLRRPSVERTPISLSHAGLASGDTDRKIVLTKVSNLRHVNKLVPDQTITFGPSVTAIYGQNGSGKSGYARVFGCAGFTRGDSQVLPDVTAGCGDGIIPSADIDICCDGDHQTICYKADNRCAQLASFHVFDATSVQVHLTQSYKFSFSPGGLNYLTRLAEETDKVRERLKALVQKCEEPHDFRPLFPDGETAVTKTIDTLGPKTDVKEIDRLATLTNEDKLQIKRLDQLIAKLKAQDVSKSINTLTQQIADLARLVTQLEQLSTGLDDSLLSQLTKQLTTYKQAEAAVKKLSLDQFQTGHFKETGTPLWRAFVEAAKDLAEVEGTPEKPYPQPGDHCLLCHQPLSEPARQFVHLLWKYLKGEAQADFDQAKTDLGGICTKIKSLSLDFFADQSVTYRYLEEHKPKLRLQVTTFIKKANERQQAMILGINSCSLQTVPSFAESPVPAIKAHSQAVGKKLLALKEQDQTEELGKLQQELLELSHRVILHQQLEKVKVYVSNRGWAKRAASAGGSTRQITIKQNELFQELVAKGYVEEFKRNLGFLGRSINVTLETPPRKGGTHRQIVLQNSTVSGSTPEKVLSEGEKRAVALADFITEIKLSNPNGAIILDDPVTSLDIEWKELIASLLIENGKDRQVVVFTHDLPFLYFLKKHAELLGVGILNHWIKRGDEDDQPGYVFLDNSPALEKDYKSVKKAEEWYKRAKDLSAKDQEDALKQGFGALRTCYESFVMFDLFGGVVLRFEERLSLDRLKDVVFSDSILEEIMVRYGSLSRYIEGHSHSDALYGAVKPTPKLLREEIDTFNSLRQKLKDLRNQR